MTYREPTDPCRCGHPAKDHSGETCRRCACNGFTFDGDAYERSLFTPGAILPSFESLRPFGAALAGLGLAKDDDDDR